ncbi:MAG: cation:proton antiporter [Mangrovibacterium sp.]
MGHLPTLIEDLALILMAGAIVTLLFKKIKQPLVLGYIIAGFLVGPHLSLTPTVVDTENVSTLAEIGVIFLLFSLGLEFSFKKLIHVGGAASVTALFEIVFITLTGYILGQLMGWSFVDSIFLGGMLASSSTTIIIKAFDDLGMKTKQYAHVVFGVLVVEDIVVILLLVLLPTIAVTQQFEGVELMISILKLFFFLILMVVIGIFILPTFLKRTKKFLNEETLLILSVGLCLGMVVVATRADFSAELGAFIMGFILAESTSSEKVTQIIKPVKDLFAAVFFVSIGMMIDPAMIVKYGWAVFAVTMLTIFGKLLSTTGGALISGQPLKQSIQVGMSMAQIGEFAFIVATLGLSLGVISDFLFPVAVGASAITTFTTPYMIKYSTQFYTLIEKMLPKKWLNVLNTYSVSTRTIQTERGWKKVLRSYATIVLTNGTILIALIFLSERFLLPFLHDMIKSDMISSIIGLVISFAIVSPFLWGVMAKRLNYIAYRELWVNQKYNRGPLLVLEFLRIIIGLLLIGFLVNTFFSAQIAIFVLVPVIFIVLLVFSKQIKKFYQRLEDRFLLNLSTSEPAHERRKVSEHIIPNFDVSWDAHLVELEVGPHAIYIGKTLEKLIWRETYGINIAYIKRGEDLIYTPTRDSRLFPFDKVGIIATDDQLQAFLPIFEATGKVNLIDPSSVEIVVQNILVNESNKLKGLSIRDSGIRERTSGLVIGIERDNERILNPVSSTVFERGDIVWIVGDREKIQKLNLL